MVHDGTDALGFGAEVITVAKDELRLVVNKAHDEPGAADAPHFDV